VQRAKQANRSERSDCLGVGLCPTDNHQEINAVKKSINNGIEGEEASLSQPSGQPNNQACRAGKQGCAPRAHAECRDKKAARVGTKSACPQNARRRSMDQPRHAMPVQKVVASVCRRSSPCLVHAMHRMMQRGVDRGRFVRRQPGAKAAPLAASGHLGRSRLRTRRASPAPQV